MAREAATTPRPGRSPTDSGSKGTSPHGVTDGGHRQGGDRPGGRPPDVDADDQGDPDDPTRGDPRPGAGQNGPHRQPPSLPRPRQGGSGRDDRERAEFEIFSSALKSMSHGNMIYRRSCTPTAPASDGRAQVSARGNKRSAEGSTRRGRSGRTPRLTGPLPARQRGSRDRERPR